MGELKNPSKVNQPNLGTPIGRYQPEVSNPPQHPKFKINKQSYSNHDIKCTPSTSKGKLFTTGENINVRVKRVHNNTGFQRKKGNNIYNRFRQKMRRDLFRS